MEATLSTQDVRDALRTLKSLVGRPDGRVKATSLASITTHPDGGSLTLRRWNFTDATASMATSGPISGGTVHVNSDALANAIGKAKGNVRIATEGDQLSVTTDAGSASVAIDGSGNVLPAAFSGDYGHVATITPSERERVRTVANASAPADARAVLASVALVANGDGSGEASATDTYRLHVAYLTDCERYGGCDTWIIPSNVIAQATKLASDYVTVEGSDAGGDFFRVKFLSVKGTKNARRSTYYTVSGRTIEGPYPNYRSLIPTADQSNATWTVADAAGTADVLAAFGNRQNVPAILTPSGSAVAVSAAFSDGSKRDAIAPMIPDRATIGTDEAIAFNPSYFADALRHVGDGATVNLRDSLRGALVEGEHGYALLMPMRVS